MKKIEAVIQPHKLEEVKEASLLVHVVDASASDWTEQQKTVIEVIKNLGAEKIQLITVFNKIDVVPEKAKRMMGRKDHYFISGKTGEGLGKLLQAIEHKLDSHLIEVKFTLPHSKQRFMADVYRTAHILEQNSTAEGTDLKMRIDPANWKKISHDIG